ncbi:MAG: YwaF family protein [Clostridia bacterium]|nr:YwaF family protein [Clostridia bacterium]
MFWQEYGKNEILVMMLSLLVMVGITFLLWLFLHKKDRKTRNIPLVVITVLLLGLEIAKQVVSLCEPTYDYYAIPMHFCSLFLYFFPLAVFFKGKVQRFGLTMSLVCSAWLFVLLYWNPCPIIGFSPTHVFENFSNFHTFIYHHLAVLFSLVSLSLNMYNIDKWSFLHVIIGISVYAAIAIPLSYAVNVNFCNLLESNIPFMENFRQSAGQVVYLICMWLIGIGGGFVVCGGYIVIKKLVTLKIKK